MTTVDTSAIRTYLVAEFEPGMWDIVRVLHDGSLSIVDRLHTFPAALDRKNELLDELDAYRERLLRGVMDSCNREYGMQEVND